MKIHREGKKPVQIILILLILFICGASLLPLNILWKILIVMPLFVGSLFVLWFFRIPNRTVNANPISILAPADGEIVVIEKVMENEYFGDERIQISIFMSPLNVHQNVYPIDGEVVYTKYHKGDYLVAWHPKSSTQNERSTIVLRSKNGEEILIRQIAGAVARRICTYSKVGDKAIQGSELGFIRFGSRVDIFLPLTSTIKASVSQKTSNKISVLAELLS